MGTWDSFPRPTRPHAAFFIYSIYKRAYVGSLRSGRSRRQCSAFAMIPGGSIQQQPVVVNGAGGSFLGAGNSGSAFTLDIANGGEGSSSVQNGLHHVSHQGTGASTQKAVALDAAAAASADQLEVCTSGQDLGNVQRQLFLQRAPISPVVRNDAV
jgi:hypothetical protein